MAPVKSQRKKNQRIGDFKYQPKEETSITKHKTTKISLNMHFLAKYTKLVPELIRSMNQFKEKKN